jgi:cytochrome c2
MTSGLRLRWRSHGALAALLACASWLGACMPEVEYQPRVDDGDPARGRLALSRHECGVCHVIPGVPGAVGRVGPPLNAYAHHSYIAGKFPNEPETLVRWITDPPAMAPQTAMPAIAMSEQEARDMAAYLYELE